MAEESTWTSECEHKTSKSTNIERKQLKEKVIQVNGKLKYFKTANAT